MQRVFDLIEAVADSKTTVLIHGETGTGKSLIARAIHQRSQRRSRPFVELSCGAIPETLLASELFGHERGAFTSALTEKKGLFELAHTGTLFLDDIDDVPPGVQVKLLRVLEMQQVMRVGGGLPIPIDVRLITASKVDLRELVRRNLFRADLFYRINVCPVDIPPLRDRREDVPLLVRHFLRRFAPEKALTLTPAAERALTGYDWPGNVRELRNITQRLALFSEGDVDVRDLPPEIQDGHAVDLLVRACTRCLLEESLTYNQVVACLETNLLRQALAESAGNRSQAARVLGLSLSTLRDKLKKHGLDESAETVAPDPETGRA
jgi:DNA-binding NtrC family response regulator